VVDLCLRNLEKQTYAAAGLTVTDIPISHRPPSKLTRKRPRLLNRVGASRPFRGGLPRHLRPGAGAESRRTRLQAVISQEFNKIDNIGFDMINHLINDIIVMAVNRWRCWM